MAITQVDKMKILKFFRENAFGDIYYADLVNYLGKKSKITDVEFTNFFATYIIDNLKKEQPSLNLLNKMVSTLTSFIGWLHDDKIELDIELINKLHSIRESYEEHLVISGEDRNTKLDELISSFEKDLFEFYPKVEEQQNSINLDELIAELSTLQASLSESEKEILSLTTRLEKQTRAYESKKRANTKLSSRLEEGHQREKKLEDKIKELEATIEQLNSHIATLKAEISSRQESYNYLSDLKDRIQSDYFHLKSEIKSLRKSLEEKEKQIAQLLSEEEFRIVIPNSLDYNEDRKNKIEGLIIRKMLMGKCTLEEVKIYLASNGYIMSTNELRDHFNEIKNRMTCTKPEDHISLADSISEDNEYLISIYDDTKFMDLMVVSDFHLSNFSKEIIQDMDLINEYCELNGIKLILNVGDFFSWSRLERKRKGSTCQRIVDKAIVKYPECKGIKHAILGGNHDRDMFADGVDPIKLLADAREDFINLGYGHCKITFKGSFSILDSIGMHHPNRRYPEAVGPEFYSTEKIRDTINSYYITNNIPSDDVYVELLGHIHKSGLDAENGICVVPSYRKDRVLNGAWHLRVYFGEDKHISNIIFIPVIKQKKLIPTTEICYKKQLIKK